MGHVKQKKSTSSSTSTPPETAGMELVATKDSVPHSTVREPHTRRSYPEQLNAEELISQINCRSSHNEITNDSNNNTNRNNNAGLQATDLQCRSSSMDDIEKGPDVRPRRQRPLYRRLISFIRNLWIGAKFNVGLDGKRYHNYLGLHYAGSW